MIKRKKLYSSKKIKSNTGKKKKLIVRKRKKLLYKSNVKTHFQRIQSNRPQSFSKHQPSLNKSLNPKYYNGSKLEISRFSK